MQTNFELPPARMQRPSAEKASERKHLPPAAFCAVTRLAADRPPRTSARPSMLPALAFLRIPNLDLAVERRRRERAAVGAEGEGEHVGGRVSTSTAAFDDTKSHTRTDLSHDPVAKKGGAAGGGAGEGDGRDRRLVPRQALEQLRVLQIPDVRDESVARARAHALPDGSTATQLNCAGVGETSVWKLR